MIVTSYPPRYKYISRDSDVQVFRRICTGYLLMQLSTPSEVYEAESGRIKTMVLPL